MLPALPVKNASFFPLISISSLKRERIYSASCGLNSQCLFYQYYSALPVEYHYTCLSYGIFAPQHLCLKKSQKVKSICFSLFSLIKLF